MKNYAKMNLGVISLLCTLFACTTADKNTPEKNEMKTLAYWSFEKIQHLNADSVSAPILGASLSAAHGRPCEPQPYVYDESGNGNFLQSVGGYHSPNVFSDDVPRTVVDGKSNEYSLALRRGEYIVPFNTPLPFCDLQGGWRISLSMKCNLLGTEQVFLCKEGKARSFSSDISIGFDPMECKYFVEVSDEYGTQHRMAAGEKVEAGKWYDVYAEADYDMSTDKTVLSLGVKPSAETEYQVSALSYKGMAVRHNAGQWVVGRGFPGNAPNKLSVLDGAIDEVEISGREKVFVPGMNPIFRDEFTADPAALVVGDTVYAYVGLDKAGVGGWFNMPGWLCYSSTDMKNWTPHGMVLKSDDFPNANPNGAWAAQVIEKDGKYYFYVTLDRRDNGRHMITVAVADRPTGPFKPARETTLIDDEMTQDSHRPNADIDPTVFIDDDGTPWMAWGNGDCYMVKLNKNMIELDGPIVKVPYRNFSEGPWLFKRGNLYYNVYAADAPGIQPEQICYSTAESINGPWTYRGFVTGSANHGFTIHPAVIEFKGKWYFFYHDGSYGLDGTPGGDCRRNVCVEYIYFNEDGTIQPIELTTRGVSEHK